MRKLIVLAALMAAFVLTGCAGLRVLNPFSGVTAADAEWDGVAGIAVPLGASFAPSSVDPRLVDSAKALEAILGTPVGVLLPLAVKGESAPRWIACTGKYVDQCKVVKVNSVIHFCGSVVGPGPGLQFWIPACFSAK